MEWIRWIKANDEILAWLAASGVLMFVASLLAIPVLVAMMPEDYLINSEEKTASRNPFRHLLHILKNVLGLVLVLAGLLMLVLPGQGILTIVIGLSLIDFPGKRRLQVRLAGIPRVRRSIQWIRRKSRREPLKIPNEG